MGDAPDEKKKRKARIDSDDFFTREFSETERQMQGIFENLMKNL